MDLAELVSNEDFKSLPKDEQRKVMAQNPDFSSLPVPEQDKVLARIPGGFANPPQGETQLRQGKPIREFLSNIYTPLLEGVGMVGGATVAAPSAVLSGPLAPAVEAAAGASGYAFGKGAARAIDQAVGLTEPQTFTEGAKTAAGDVKSGAMLEMGGRSVVPAVGGAINRVGKYLATDTPEFIKEAEVLAEQGGFAPTAAEKTGSTFLSRGEKVLRWLATSGGEFNKRDAAEAAKWVRWREEVLASTKGEAAPGAESIDRSINAGRKLKKIVDDYVGKANLTDDAAVNNARKQVLEAFGSTESYYDLGKTAQQMIKERNIAFGKKADALYDAAAKHVTSTDRVAPANLMTTAKQLIDEQMMLPPKSRDNALIAKLKDFASGGNLAGEIEGMPGFILKDGKVTKAGDVAAEGYTWEAVKALKGDFRSRIADYDAAVGKNLPGMKFMSSKEAGVYKRLQGALAQDIEAFAVGKGGAFEKATRVANKFYKAKVMQYRDPDVIRMSTEDPELLVDMITKADSITGPQKFKAAAGPAVFDKFKMKLTNEIFGAGKPGGFNPEAVAKELTRRQETLSQYYTPKEIGQMWEAVNVGQGHIAKGLENNKYFVDLLKKDSAFVLGGQHLGEASTPVVGYIVRHDNIPMLQKLEGVVGKQEMANLRATWLSNVITTNRAGLVQPSQLTKMLKTYGTDTMEAFLGKETTANIAAMEKVGTAQRAVEEIAKNPSGTAQGLMTYFTVLRTGADLAKGNLWGVITELWPPNLIAKLYLSKTGTQLLTGTWDAAASSAVAAQAHTRLLGLAMKETGRQLDDRRP